MCDYNAKVGSNNTGREQVMGTHGEGVINANEELFGDLCAFNNMVNGGSVFPHKRIHKTTWVSPDNSTENQIDRICISKRFRQSMQDVRVYRGLDVASDHHLAVAKSRLKLKKIHYQQHQSNTKIQHQTPSRSSQPQSLSGCT